MPSGSMISGTIILITNINWYTISFTQNFLENVTTELQHYHATNYVSIGDILLY